MFYWTGVGSREVPADIARTMGAISAGLQKVGGILRSGGAPGADVAFEKGVTGTAKEIYLPSKGFNYSKSTLYADATPEALEIVKKAHPYFNKMKPGSFPYLAHSRNVSQVVGPTCDKPSAFLVCWTPDGAESTEECHSVDVTGGTRTAIVIAHMHNIPVFNLCRPDALFRLQTYVKERQLVEREPWHPDPVVIAAVIQAKEEKKARNALKARTALKSASLSTD